MRAVWPHGVYYAEPRNVTNLSDCYFYHTMEIPGYGLVEGQWDLRDGIREYTGGLDFDGKRVLEIGTASGFVCFYMERQGADVIGYDLSEHQSWDLVPHALADNSKESAERRYIIRKINNGYWLAHKAFGSKANVVYGTVYEVPAAMGPVDISTFCSVLLHLRDPFLALYNAARLTRKTMLVTEILSPNRDAMISPEAGPQPMMEFIPHLGEKVVDIWWHLSPEIVIEFLRVLGFDASRVTFHSQRFALGQKQLFSVVAHRARGRPEI